MPAIEISCHLHLSGHTEPLTSAALADRLRTRGATWIWVRGLSSSDAPAILRENDGLHVFAANRVVAEGLAIRDAGGRPLPSLGPASQGVIARVDRLWRAPRTIALDRAPWHQLLAHPQPKLWSALEALHETAHRAAWLVDQWTGRPLEPRTSSDAQRDIYESPVALETITHLASGELFDAEEELRKRYLRAGDHVLVIGSGAGREAFAFARHGLSVCGIDVSRDAVAAARANCPFDQVRFEVMAFDELRFPDASFDAIFVASDISIPGRNNRVAALARCRNILRPGGRLMLPAVIIAGRARLAHLLIDLPRRAGRRLLGEQALAEPGDRWTRLWPDSNAVSFKHQYASTEEVIAEAEAAGLRSIDRVSLYFVFAR